MNSNSTTLVYCLHPKEIYFFGPRESYYAINIPVVVFNVILLVFIVVGNVAVILAYCRNKNLQNVPNMLLMTLAVSDLVVGLVSQPLFIVILIRDMLGAKPSCLLAMLFSLSLKTCGGVSMMTLSLIISPERYLAIAHPFKHRRTVTKTRVKILVCLLWSFLLSLNAILLLGVSYRVYFLVLSALILTGVIATSLACFGILNKWHISRKRQSSISSNEKARKQSTGSFSTVSAAGSERKDFKITKTMFYIVGAIILCYTPLLGAMFFAQIKGLDKIYLKYLFPSAATLVYLNSFLNPVIYCLRNRNFTRAIRKMIGFHSDETRERCNGIEHPVSF